MSDKDDKLRRELDAFIADYNHTNKTDFKPTGVKGSRKRTGKGTQGHRQFGAVDLSAYGKSDKETSKFMRAMARRGFRVIDEIDAKSKRRSKRNVIHIDSMREDTGNNKEKRGTIRKERRVKQKSNNYPIQRIEKDQLYRSEMTSSQKESLDNKDKGFSSLMQGGQSREVMSLPREKEEKKLSLKEKLQGLSQIDPEGSNTKENINAVLENDPTQLVPQISKDTPRVAMRQDAEGNQFARDIVFKQKKKEEEKLATAIASNPQAVKELALSKVEEPELKAEVLQDIEAKEQGAPRQEGPASQFTEALTFFLPQIIGGLAGAALEGTEGAIGGIQQAGAARDAFLKHQQGKEAATQKQANFETQQAQKDEDQAIQAAKSKRALGKTDITPDYQTKKGKLPVYSRTNPKTGLPEMIDSNGKVMDPKDLEKISTFEANIRQQGITDRQGRSLDDKAIDRIDKSFKSFTTKPDVVKIRQGLDVTAPVINLLQSGMPVTGDFLAPFIARGVQSEVGNLSETDLKNARVPQAIAARIASDAKGFLSGNMTDKERQATIRLLAYIDKQKISQLEDKVKGYATDARSTRNKLSKDDMISQLRQEMGLESSGQKKSSNEIKSGFDAEKQKRFEEFKAKRGQQ